jgi:hypothetical protein
LGAQLAAHPDERLSTFSHMMKEYGFEKMIPIYDSILGDRALVPTRRPGVLPRKGQLHDRGHKEKPRAVSHIKRSRSVAPHAAMCPLPVRDEMSAMP